MEPFFTQSGAAEQELASVTFGVDIHPPPPRLVVFLCALQSPRELSKMPCAVVSQTNQIQISDPIFTLLDLLPGASEVQSGLRTTVKAHTWSELGI